MKTRRPVISARATKGQVTKLAIVLVVLMGGVVITASPANAAEIAWFGSR
jgi:hypothetical protein